MTTENGTRTYRSLKNVQVMAAAHHVHIHREILEPMNNRDFADKLSELCGFPVSPSSVKSMREGCGLPPRKPGWPKRKKNTVFVRSRGDRRICSEVVRIFRILGVPDSELTALSDFAGGKAGYPKQGGDDNNETS